MENADMRHILETELLKFVKAEKPLSQTQFNRYYDCLLTLFRLDRLSVFEQKKIYTAAYGDIGNFILEFLKYVSPLIEKRGKKIYTEFVSRSRTKVLFSPRLTEIALGCMLSVILGKNDTADISIFGTKNHVVIGVIGKHMHQDEAALSCIKKIAELHSGRIICSFAAGYSVITLIIPVSPLFQPMRVIPCAPTLCRLCHI